MRRIFLWIFGLLVGVPTLVVSFFALMHFGVYPLQHRLHVAQADRTNAAIWRTGEAKVSTVTLRVREDGVTRVLTTDLACFVGETARPWTLKDGAPRRFRDKRLIGPGFIETTLNSGNRVFVDLTELCLSILQEDQAAFSAQLADREIKVLNTRLDRFCLIRPEALPDNAVVTSAPKSGPIETRPLSDVVEEDALGTSALPATQSAFWRIYGFNIKPALWSSQNGCWTDKGSCDDALTRLCSPRQN